MTIIVMSALVPKMGEPVTGVNPASEQSLGVASGAPFEATYDGHLPQHSCELATTAATTRTCCRS